MNIPWPGAVRAIRERRLGAIRLRAEVDEYEVTDLLHGRYRGAVDDLVLRRGDGVPAYNLPADARGIAAWSPAPDRFGRWTLARGGETALFDILEPPWVSNVVARQRWPWS